MTKRATSYKQVHIDKIMFALRKEGFGREAGSMVKFENWLKKQSSDNVFFIMAATYGGRR
jgi:hypothetical protein